MTKRAVRYKIREINLATARVNEAWDVAGGLVYMLTATDKSAAVSLRFDGPQEEPVGFTKGDGVETKFNRLYISHAAQADKTMTILVTPGMDVFRFLLAPQVADIDTIGTISTITTLENIADDLTRLLGVVDISDDDTRLLGIVKSIADPVDVSDRAARALGVIASITASVAVDDGGGSLSVDDGGTPLDVNVASGSVAVAGVMESETHRQKSRVLTTRRVSALVTISGSGAFTSNLYTVPTDKVLDLGNITLARIGEGGGNLWGVLEVQFGAAGSWYPVHAVMHMASGSGFGGGGLNFPPGTVMAEEASIFRFRGLDSTGVGATATLHGWLLDESETS